MAFVCDASANDRKNYDQLLAKAIAGLPGASVDQRREVYDRARAALSRQLQKIQLSGGQRDIIAEEKALGEAIERVEASVTAEEKALGEEIERLEASVSGESAATPSPPQLQKSPTWLTDILGRASRDAPLTLEPKRPPQPASPARSPMDFALKPAEEKGATFKSRLQQALQRPLARGSAPTPAKQSKEGQGTSRLDDLDKVLRKLLENSLVEASALVSVDGLMIASALTTNLEGTRIAGIAATLQNLGSRAAIELGRGETSEVIVRGENGYAVMISAGRGTLLLALANESAKLGLVFLGMQEAIKALQSAPAIRSAAKIGKELALSG